MIVITLSKRLSILPTVMHEFSQPSEATSPPPSWPTHHHRPAHAGTRRARRHGRHERPREHLVTAVQRQNRTAVTPTKL